MSKRKKRFYGKLFRLFSILLILSCCVVYGYRFVKYYKIYNPKETEKNGGLLSIAVPKNSVIVTSGDGLYHIGGSYIYKGNVDNNYISFSGLTFRILKMTYGSNVEIVLDDVVTSLAYNKDYTSYDKSDINKYLNEYFIKHLNTDLLAKSTVCLDKITSISDTTSKCDESYDKDYIKLLDINTYLNTITDSSYLNSEDGHLWLNNVSDNMIWHTNGYSISTSMSNAYYGIKPVITLDSEVELLGGDGSIDNPYRVDAIPDYSIGNYVSLDNDLYRIINTSDKTITLESDGVLAKLHSYGNNVNFDLNDNNSLAYYLNNEYYQSLSYKDIIIKTSYLAGNYNDSIDSINKNIEAYVSIPSVLDFQFNKGSIQYYLSNYYDENKVFIYDNGLNTTRYTNTNSIKTIITISKDVLKKGNGSIDDPYKMEG